MDADAEIERKAGKTIPEIFTESGEAGFRAWETRVLSQLGSRSGLVIATGGGCVTREENYPLLHQNGTIFCLHRPLEQLPTDGRPLSQQGKLEEMYRIRKPMYQRFADHHIHNDSDAQDAAAAIIKLWEDGK